MEAENSILRENIPIDVLEKLTLQPPTTTLIITNSVVPNSINNNNYIKTG